MSVRQFEKGAGPGNELVSGVSIGAVSTKPGPDHGPDHGPDRGPDHGLDQRRKTRF